MSKYSFRLYADTLPAKAVLEDAPTGVNRILYVAEGAASIRCGAQAMSLAQNSAWCASASCEVRSGASGAQLLRWELADAGAAAADRSAQTRLLLERELDLGAADGYLFRCDRVDFPPGGIAYTHTHQGPGIRCLLKGEFSVETGGEILPIVPGGAWFESGPDPVLATAREQSPAAFVRVMILPRSLLGRSSIRYVKPEDQDKSKSQQYQVFIDEFIDL